MNLQKSKIVPFSSLFAIVGLPETDDPHSFFLNAVQQAVDAVIPQSLWDAAGTQREKEVIFHRLASLLPLFHSSYLDDSSTSISITYLCPGEYTQARRYVVDILSKSLIPGKRVEIAGGISLNFQFLHDSNRKFFIAQEIVSVKTREENLAIQKNLPSLLTELRKNLSFECSRPSESSVHSIFMPRNEEEMIRNLIVLTNQIRYVRDLPQVSIHYEKQTEQELTFTIIIAHLLRPNARPLKKIFEKSSLKVDIDDVRMMGYVKHKYPKEAGILRFTVNKKSFFRADDSIDLLKARQEIVLELRRCLGEFRDFNGGMILKQEEALTQLRQEIGKLSQKKELLLENFFYSIKPGIMQTVHDTSLLKRHFDLLNRALDSQQIETDSVGNFSLCFVITSSRAHHENLLKAIALLDLSSRDLTTSFLEVNQSLAMGFILQTERPEMVKRFYAALIPLVIQESTLASSDSHRL